MKPLHCTIIGGGPAGTATAIRLQQFGYVTALVERSTYEHWRVGETLPPAIQVPLKTLGVWQEFLGENFLPSQSICSAWGCPELSETHFLLNPYGNGWHIDRAKFDRMLAGAAQKAGCRLLLETQLAGVETRNGRWELRLKKGGKPLIVESEIIVDATGRSATLARQLGSRIIRYEQLVGITRFLSPNTSKRLPSPNLLLEACPEGWWYSAPLPDQKLLITFMTDAAQIPNHRTDQAQYWATNLAQAPHTKRRARGSAPGPEMYVSPAGSTCLDRINGSNWLAVGDAACSFDPLSGRGISKALYSGIAAAGYIRDFFEGENDALDCYFEKIKSGFAAYLRTRNQYYGMESRWPDAPFWQKRRQVACV